MSTNFVTREELADAVRVLDRRMERFEHSLNRLTLVFGTALFLVFLTEVIILARVGQ